PAPVDRHLLDHDTHVLLSGADQQLELPDTFLVVACQDRVHTGLLERSVRVDGDDPAVREHAAHEGRVEHARQLHVVDEVRLALQEPLVLEAGEVLADPAPRDGRAHPLSNGSKGSVCSDSAPRSVTTVSAPSWRPMRSSGVTG